MDDFSGNNEDPQSLHKYLYAHNNPINMIDPAGLEGLVSTIVTAAIRQGLMGMAMGAPFRVLDLAMNLRAGIHITEAAKSFLIGMTVDFGIGAALGVGGKLLKFCQPTMRLRKAGEAMKRSARSIWNLSPFQRGKEIHRTILNRLPNLAENFPVIDDFVNGVATSIKSLDLTAKTYQNTTALVSKLSGYVDDLARFAGRSGGSTPIRNSDITRRVLLIAVENGAATQPQKLALDAFMTKVATKWPNVKIVFQWI